MTLMGLRVVELQHLDGVFVDKVDQVVGWGVAGVVVHGLTRSGRRLSRRAVRSG